MCIDLLSASGGCSTHCVRCGQPVRLGDSDRQGRRRRCRGEMARAGTLLRRREYRTVCGVPGPTRHSGAPVYALDGHRDRKRPDFFTQKTASCDGDRVPAHPSAEERWCTGASCVLWPPGSAQVQVSVASAAPEPPIDSSSQLVHSWAASSDRQPLHNSGTSRSLSTLPVEINRCVFSRAESWLRACRRIIWLNGVVGRCTSSEKYRC